MTDAPPARLRGDRGAVGGAEVLPLGLLVLVVGALLVANAWGVVDAKLAVGSAAREASRTLVEADDPSQAVPAADAAGRSAFAAHGRRPEQLVLDLPDGSAGRLDRCAIVTVRATTRVPAVVLPFLGPRGEGFTVTATHTERVDPYRSSGTGTGSC